MLSDFKNLQPPSDESNDRISIALKQLNSIEDFNQVLPPPDCAASQLSAGPVNGNFWGIQMEGLQLYRFVINCSLYTKGIKTSNGILICIPLGPTFGNIISHKTPLSDKPVFGFDPTREVNLVTPQQLDLATVVVSPAILQKQLQCLERDDIDEQFLKLNYIQTPDESFDTLQRYLQQIFYLATTDSSLLRRSQRLLKGDLLPLVVNCFYAAANHKLQLRPFRRSAVVQQAEDFICNHLDQPVTLEDICQSVGTSKRALSYGFQEIFGMSPMAYLKTARLNGVRYALQKSDSLTNTVWSIANRYGFWHMGHFSQEYKQMFGESPSETLRNSKPGNS